jgi:hypothetical protein
LNPFTSAFKTEALKRVVKYIPLVEIELPNDINGNVVPTGYLSDRDITIGGTVYVRKLLTWDGVSYDIAGSTSNPSFTFSNVDRIFEIASQLYFFLHAQVTLKFYQPSVVTGGGSAADATRIVWKGYIDKINYDAKIFKINCKDGFFALTQPVPRRRATFMCDWKFDDGCYCPYSGYGKTGAGSGSLVTIANMAGVVGEAAIDFSSDINVGIEGHYFGPGFTDCPKTFDACKQRGMWRFFGGLRYVSSWAVGYSRGFFSRVFGTSGTQYSSFSSSNPSIFNNAIPLVYTTMGYVMTPQVFQFRSESEYLAAEAIVSSGTVAVSYKSDGETNSIGDIFLNGLPPHQGQTPTPLEMGVIRSGGRVGETLLWDAIGGDLLNTDTPGDPPLYFNNISGVFIRVKELDAGINNPQYDSGGTTATSPQTEPSIQVEILAGRNCWIYSSTSSRSLAPSGNPGHIFLDIALDALDMKYVNSATHAQYLNLQEIINVASYCTESVTSIIDGTSTQRYRFSGMFGDLRNALDQLDATLQDCYGFRFWRNGLLCPGVFAAGHFDATPRPAFKEFVNIIDGSFSIEILYPEHNEYQLQFGNAAQGYQKSLATVFSEKFQVLSGTGGRRNINSQTISLTGTPTMDQAVRIGSQKLKDELGGSSIYEWQSARKITLKTGFFMDEIEVGDISYVAHSLVPNGGDWFRITKKNPNNDYTLTFVMTTYRPNNYLIAGQPQ